LGPVPIRGKLGTIFTEIKYFLSGCLSRILSKLELNLTQKKEKRKE
jgi:hypothetical protein